ncbi:MAG: putative RNA methyltransferase [Bulleidia sp.]
MSVNCPICGKPLDRKENTAVCQNGHCFDYAKQGYVNLLIRQSVDHGDNKDMVKARTKFLESGSYAFLRDALCTIIAEEPCHTLADLGCGEGYYTAAFPCEEKYGFDMSKEALKTAARKDKGTSYAVASIFRLPLPDACMDVCLTCFAPFAGDEIERVLKDQGRFIFVSPAPYHLFELKQAVYEHPYENRVEELETSMVKESEEIITRTFRADHDTLTALFEMTPYVHRTRKEDMRKLESLEGMDITASFVIRVYRKTV